MKVAVQDANILIDLIESGIFSEFFALGIETHTTSLVLFEIERSDQIACCTRVVSANQLRVHEVSTREYLELFETERGGLSVTDMSVLHLAREKTAILLSGDGALRRRAGREGIPVHGILWVLDRIVESEIIPAGKAAALLCSMRRRNLRLPREEINKRIRRWREG